MTRDDTVFVHLSDRFESIHTIWPRRELNDMGTMQDLPKQHTLHSPPLYLLYKARARTGAKRDLVCLSSRPCFAVVSPQVKDIDEFQTKQPRDYNTL